MVSWETDRNNIATNDTDFSTCAYISKLELEHFTVTAAVCYSCVHMHLPRMDSVVEMVVPNLIRSSAHALMLLP